MHYRRSTLRHVGIILQIFVAFFALLVTLAAARDGSTMPKIRRGFYSLNKITAYAPFEYDKSALLDFCAAQTALDPALDFSFGRTYFSGDMDVRYLYFSQGAEPPPTIAGRFFTQSEMLSAEPLAVIGADFLEDVYLGDDGLSYIDISRTAYQVVGVLGIGEPSRLDSIVYLPLGAIGEGAGQWGSYIIDSPSVETLIDLAPSFSALLMLEGTNNAFHTEYLSSENAVVDALAQRSNITRISLVLFASVCLSALFFTARWVGGCAALLRTGRTLGFHVAQIFWLVWAPYAARAVCGIALAGALYAMLDAADILLRLPTLWIGCAFGAMLAVLTLQIALLVAAALRRLERKA